MKKIKIEQKLNLNKETVSALNSTELNALKGGAKISSIHIPCITLLTVNGCASGKPCYITNVERCEDTLS